MKLEIAGDGCQIDDRLLDIVEVELDAELFAVIWPSLGNSTIERTERSH